MNENQPDDNSLLFRSMRQDDPKDNPMESRKDSIGGEEPSLFRSFMDSEQSESQPRLFSATNESSLPGSNPEDEPRLSTGAPEIDQKDQEDQEDLSDSAFPLFLSFKANDAVKSVTDAVRERNAAKSLPVESIQASASKQPDPAIVKAEYDHPYDDFGGSLYIGDLEKPIFKPDSGFSKEEPVYEIPPVFGSSRDYHEQSKSADIFSESRDKDTITWGDAPDQLSGPETVNDMAEGSPFRQNSPEASFFEPKAKIQKLSQESPSEDSSFTDAQQLVSSDAETELSEEISTAEVPVMRPGTRYSAAQQTGSTPPKMTSAKKMKPIRPFPILITLLCVTLAVVLFTMMSGNFGFTSPDSSALLNGQSSADNTVGQTVTSVKSSETTDEPAASPSPIPTAAPTTVAAAEASISGTTAESSSDATSPSASSAHIRSGFTTSITDGKAAGDVASFVIQFRNTGGNDVSLFDGVEYITITFAAEGVTISEVTSDAFTFTADPDKANTFIGLPVSTDTIAFRDTLPVLVSAKSDDSNFGGFSVKYFVKCYE